MHKENLSASEALEKLKAGNQRYLSATANPGDVSPKIRHKTCTEGQEPYAIVITCSDSRVIPESIFSAGIGELFVIRVGAAISDKPGGYVKYITDEILKAIGEEKDPLKASCLNAKKAAQIIKESLDIKEGEGPTVCSAVYHIDSGEVEFLDK